jgi:hypothetical protein
MHVISRMRVITQIARDLPFFFSKGPNEDGRRYGRAFRLANGIVLFVLASLLGRISSAPKCELTALGHCREGRTEGADWQAGRTSHSGCLEARQTLSGRSQWAARGGSYALTGTVGCTEWVTGTKES